MITTLDQDRARHALAQVQQIATLAPEIKKSYRSYAAGLPAAILMNGLGQTAATLLAAGDEPHRKLYEHVADWLREAQVYDSSDLVRQIVTKDQQHYLRAQAEALAYLSWLKKFAAAYLPREGA